MNQGSCGSTRGDGIVREPRCGKAHRRRRDRGYDNGGDWSGAMKERRGLFLLIQCYLALVLGLLTSVSLAPEGSENGKKKMTSGKKSLSCHLF